MFFELFKKLKTKTLLIGAGFLVLAGLVGFATWFYFNFLKSSDESFLEIVPAEAAVYWQSDFSKGADDAWLWAMGRAVLSEEAAEQTIFLEDFVAPEADKIGFAVLSDFADFIFLSRIDDSEFDSLRNKLEELNYHYIVESGGRAIISNSRFGLEEAMSVLNQEKSSLASNRMRLISFSRAKRHYPARIYFGENFKVDDFRALPWFSDFWSDNKLVVSLKSGTKTPRNLADFDFLAVFDNEYLKKNIEEVLKDDLAVLLPEIQEKVLPDGTKVKELLANPDAFVFEDRKIGGSTFRYLLVSGLGQEFLISRECQKTIFSNSGKMMEVFWENSSCQPDYYGKNLIELFSDWLKWLTADFRGAIFGINVDNL